MPEGFAGWSERITLGDPEGLRLLRPRSENAPAVCAPWS